MTIMMIATMVPASAFAVESADGSSQQITKSSVKMTTSETLENGDVEINKSITGTDTENVFDITLDVTTAENLEEIPTSADAAVVLVVDRSGSMRWSISGEEDGSNERYNSAISAAKNFVTEFGKDAENSKRLVQVVQFSGDAVKKSSWGWEDVATETGLSGSKNDIETISEPSGGTNIEGGLQLAYNLINQAKNNETLKGISNVNVILLTDGCPTYHVKERTRNSTTEVEGEQGGGSWAEWEDHYSVTKTDGIAAKLKNLDVNGGKVSLYSIAFSAGTAQFAVNESNNETENKNVYDWLSSFSSKAFNSNNQQELINSFGKIVKIIKLGAQAWYVHDPMASNIIYKGAPSSSGDNVYTFSENKLLWDLKNSKPEVKEEGSKTYYHYSLKYPVALDTTTEGFAFDTSMPTNNATVLDYFMFSKIDEETTTELKHANFDVPEVKGLCGSLEFTKSDENGNPLKGAEFKLIGTAVGNGKDVTLKATSGADGKVSFSRIPSGTYKLTESGVPAGYTGDTTEYNVTVSYGKVTSSDIPGDGIINTRIKTKVEGKKVWVDGNNVSKTRPESITVKLMNGEDVVKTQTVTPDADGNWTYSFTELPKYDENYKVISYTVEEEAVEGYTSTVKGTTITNTLNQVKDVTVEGEKVWVDGDNADKTRPESITVKLMNGEDVVKTQTVTPDAEGNWTYSFTGLEKYDENYNVITYTVKEEAVEGYTSTVEGTTITNTIKQDTVTIEGTKTWIDPEGTVHPEITINLLRNGEVYKSVKLANGETSYKFEGLDKYDSRGFKYAYKVVEEEVPGYQTTYDNNNVVNTIIQEEISVSGTKTWIDPEGTKHPEITIKLLRDGEPYGDPITLKDGETDYSFDNLPKYDLTDGHIYEYTVDEVSVDGYTSNIDEYNITNTIKQDYVSVAGTKTWKDPEGTAHPAITINLLQDGTEIDEVVLQNGTTTYEFTDLEKYDLEDGHEYIYTVTEDSVEGYISVKDNNNFTNTIEPGQTTISGVKTWIAPQGTEFPTVKIVLLQNGNELDSVELTNGNTEYSFDVPVYDSEGQKYEYAIAEADVAGYTSVVDGYNVTNTIEQESIDIAGTKEWNAPEGTEVPDVTIDLLRDGEVVDSTVIKSGESEYSFTGLDKYDLSDGHVYDYNIQEEDTEGYSAEYDGYDIVNTINQNYVSVSGTKSWVAPEGTEFPDITINLLKNGEEVDEVVLQNGQTDFTFDGLEEYSYEEDGTVTVNEYTVTEDEVEGYTSSIDGYNITNEKNAEPVIPDDKPKTGDNFNIMLFAGAALAALLAALAIIFTRRRRNA